MNRIAVVLVAFALVACSREPSSTLAARPAVTVPQPTLATEDTAASTTPGATEPELTPSDTGASILPHSSANPAATAELVVGEMVETAVDALRARAQPGTSSDVVDTLPAGAPGLVELGPIAADGYAWYRVQFAYLNAFGVTDGGTGWIASGSPDAPWLVDTDRTWDHGPISGFAGTESRVLGPIEMDDPWQEIRWAALGTDCAFQLAFESASELAVAVDVVIDGFADGEIEDLFPDTPEFVGSVTVRITSACAWTFSTVTYIG